jgi:hypothetical protein
MQTHRRFDPLGQVLELTFDMALEMPVVPVFEDPSFYQEGSLTGLESGAKMPRSRPQTTGSLGIS